ncbi:MAG: hypothetical protein PVI57_08165 [Gemmatimonadota bacterium]|jgi:hypothetical protein
MTRLVHVEPSMFDEIHDHLLTLLDPSRPREEWRRIFECSWSQDQEHVGRALYDGDEPVAFLGLLFHERVVDGRLRRFCNISSWIAKPEYRKEATLLALGLRRLGDHTITNLSPNEVAFAVFERLGFEVLERDSTILSPYRILGLSHWWSGTRVSNPLVRRAEVLDDGERRILEDHRDFAHHALAEHPGGHCHVVYTMGRRRRQRSIRIHHFSSRESFVRSLPGLQLHWLRRHGATLAECDSRLLEGSGLTGTRNEPRTNPRLYRSAGLDPGQIDNLYSEVVLLNLA